MPRPLWRWGSEGLVVAAVVGGGVGGGSGLVFEEVDLVGDDLVLGVAAAVAVGPFPVLEAARDANSAALGHVLGDGLGLGAEGDDVDVDGAGVFPVALAAGDGEADGAGGGAGGGVAEFGVSGEAADELKRCSWGALLGWVLCGTAAGWHGQRRGRAREAR